MYQGVLYEKVTNKSGDHLLKPTNVEYYIFIFLLSEACQGCQGWAMAHFMHVLFWEFPHEAILVLEDGFCMIAIPCISKLFKGGGEPHQIITIVVYRTSGQ